ncbi:MAG: putative bifunctional diguanylate cyclase/phosphodiesterase [Acetobacteraceae bacterium]
MAPPATRPAGSTPAPEPPGSREAALLRANALLQTALDTMSQGLCLFDEQETLLFINRAFLDLYHLAPARVPPGISLSHLLELRVEAGNYAGRSAEELYADAHARICAGEVQSYQQRLRDGRIVSIFFRPIPGVGYVATHQDITPLKQREEELGIQNMRFETALANMSQGLVMFDRDSELIVCNPRYGEIYQLPPELTRPGTPLSAILHYRTTNTTYALPDADSHIANRLAIVAARRPSDSVLELADGRSIAVAHRPMPDGGFVATFEDVTERIRADRQIAHIARHDPLTDLPNRLMFREQIEAILTRGRDTLRMAVLCLDLDRFKAVNDTLGHPLGDALLREVAERLRDNVREEDCVARFGGDEFALLHAVTGNVELSARLARRVIDAVSRPYEIDGHRIVIGASIGIALYPDHGREPDQLLKNADLALYAAKADGRNTFRFFEREMDRQAQARRALELDLRAALALGQMELHFQPIVSLATCEIASCEALIRWHHPTRGLVPPMEFIPLAEEIGLIVQLGEWVLHRACAVAAAWPDGIAVAVNLSAVQFKRGDLVATVSAALDLSGLPASRLELEITESVLLQGSVENLAILHRLRALGIRISMDDFGTGHSSLSYLRSFPFDKIKIDRSFVRHFGESADCTAIVHAVTGLARNLGIITTAEGVETREQFDRLQREGCTEVQGFYIGHPVPAEQLRLHAGRMSRSLSGRLHATVEAV